MYVRSAISGIGHDRGRIGVDQDDLVTLFAEGFARLRAGIIEFARLPDDDRAGADEQDFVDISTFWHGLAFSKFPPGAAKRANNRRTMSRVRTRKISLN